MVGWWPFGRGGGVACDGAQGLKVVITGGSRGLGFALASAFLRAGDAVLLTSRTEEGAAAAVQRLQAVHGSVAAVHSAVCDVRDSGAVEAVADAAVAALGRVDVWVNNAALSQTVKAPLTASDPGELRAVLDTNLLGSMYGARAALRVMRAQPGGGRVWLVDGAGARGNATPGNVAYGASKRALTQLRASLAAECKGSEASVHMFSPGMVATDLLLKGVSSARNARIVNILAEEPDAVAAWLVPQLRKPRRGGSSVYIKYLTILGVLWRFLTARRRRNRFLNEGEFERKRR